MWQLSAWFLLFGALIQFVQSIVAWGRESNVQLVEDTRKFRDGWDARMRELIENDAWASGALEAAQSEYMESHKPGRDVIIRRQSRRYWWNVAGWLAIVVGALLNLVHNPGSAGLLERMRGTLAQLRDCAAATCRGE